MKGEELALILAGIGIAGFVGYTIASKGKPEEELKKLASNISNVPQISQYRETISKEVQTIKEKYVEKIPDNFKALYNDASKSLSNVSNQLNNITNTATNTVNQYVEKGKQFTQEQIEKGKQTLNEVLSKGKEKTQQTVNNLLKPITDKYEEAKKTINDIKDKIVTYGTLALGVGLGYLLFRGTPVTKVVIESQPKFLGISLPFGIGSSYPTVM
jgi:ABC-type transporter Mla subunit MlaD